MRPDKLLASFDLGFERVIDGDEGLDVRQGMSPNENLSTARLGLEALCDVDHIADDRIFHPHLRANVADDGFAAVDANSHVQRGLTTTVARGVEGSGSTLH